MPSVMMPALRVEQPAEHAREGQHVVDLVGVVAAAGGHHGRILHGRVRVDLGIRVGQREHNGVGAMAAMSSPDKMPGADSPMNTSASRIAPARFPA